MPWEPRTSSSSGPLRTLSCNVSRRLSSSSKSTIGWGSGHFFNMDSRDLQFSCRDCRGGICGTAVYEGKPMNQGKSSTFTPIIGPLRVPSQFTPMEGFLGLARRAASQLGLSQMWPGPDGLEGVVRQKLSECGIPAGPVPLKALTPRQMAEAAGFIKKNRRKRLKR